MTKVNHSLLELNSIKFFIGKVSWQDFMLIVCQEYQSHVEPHFGLGFVYPTYTFFKIELTSGNGAGLTVRRLIAEENEEKALDGNHFGS